MIEPAALPAQTSDGVVIDLAHLLSGITNLAGILIVRADDRIVYANQRFLERWEIPEKVFEHGLHQPLTQAMAHNVSHPDAFLARIRELETGTRPSDWEEICLLSGRMLQRCSAPARTPQGKEFGRVWYVRDITDHKRADAERAGFAALTEALIDYLLDAERDATPLRIALAERRQGLVGEAEFIAACRRVLLDSEE
ncbi:MAG: hypothetical protein M3450_14305 [Actinomycetota bacterium]|nr:hypothetical protein [Actinomycetota bacterium]